MAAHDVVDLAAERRADLLHFVEFDVDGRDSSRRVLHIGENEVCAVTPHGETARAPLRLDAIDERLIRALQGMMVDRCQRITRFPQV